MVLPPLPSPSPTAPLVYAGVFVQQERAIWISESNADLVCLERQARPFDGLRFRRRSSVETLPAGQTPLLKRQGVGATVAKFNVQLRRRSAHSSESDRDVVQPALEAVDRRESIPPGWLQGARRRNSKQIESGSYYVHGSGATQSSLREDESSQIPKSSAHVSAPDESTHSLPQSPITAESYAVASFIPPQPTAPRLRPLSYISLRGGGRSNSMRRSSTISVVTSTHSSSGAADLAAAHNMTSTGDVADVQVISLGHISEDVDINSLSAELDRLAKLVGSQELPLSLPLSPASDGQAGPTSMLLHKTHWRVGLPLLSPPLSAGSTATTASTDEGDNDAEGSQEMTPRMRPKRWKETQAGDPALCDPLWSQSAPEFLAAIITSSGTTPPSKSDRLIPRPPIPRSSRLYRRGSWGSSASFWSTEDPADLHSAEEHDMIFREDGQRMAVLPNSDKGNRRRLLSLAEVLSASELDELEVGPAAPQTPKTPQERAVPPLLSPRMRTLSGRRKEGARGVQQGRRTVPAPTSPSPMSSSPSTGLFARGHDDSLNSTGPPSSSPAQRISKPMVPISDWLDGQSGTGGELDPVASLRHSAGVPRSRSAGRAASLMIAHSQSPTLSMNRSPSSDSAIVQTPIKQAGEILYPAPRYHAENQADVTASLARSPTVPMRQSQPSAENPQPGITAPLSRGGAPYLQGTSPDAAISFGAGGSSPPSLKDRRGREPRVSALPAPCLSRMKSPGARVRFADI